MLMMHHSGAITVMLPACMYYADNVHVQQTALGLLGFASLTLPLQLISSSRDVYDLKERGQFTVAFVVQTVVFLYFRWFVCVQGMYGVVRYEFPSFSWHPSDYFYFVGAIWIPNFMTNFTMSFLLYECVCGVVCLVTNDVFSFIHQFMSMLIDLRILNVDLVR